MSNLRQPMQRYSIGEGLQVWAFHINYNNFLGLEQNSKDLLLLCKKERRRRESLYLQGIRIWNRGQGNLGIMKRMKILFL